MKTRKAKASLWGSFVKTASTVFPENHILQVSQYQIASERIPKAFEGYKIVHLSDLHGSSFGRNNSRLLEKINSAAPDAVVMTGDMADRQTKNYEGFFHFCRTLSKKYPVYFSIGNHEQELLGSRRKEFLEGMRENGVHVLDNKSENLEKGGEKIPLYGVRIPLRCYRSGSKCPQLSAEEIQKLLGGCPKDEFTVLLAHNPFFFDVYAGWGANLTLSGHVHGGMVRLPGHRGLLSPERKFFPRYSEGIYESEHNAERKMLVSRGLGSGARIFNRPELIVITLCHISQS